MNNVTISQDEWKELRECLGASEAGLFKYTMDVALRIIEATSAAHNDHWDSEMSIALVSLRRVRRALTQIKALPAQPEYVEETDDE